MFNFDIENALSIIYNQKIKYGAGLGRSALTLTVTTIRKLKPFTATEYCAFD